MVKIVANKLIQKVPEVTPEPWLSAANNCDRSTSGALEVAAAVGAGGGGGPGGGGGAAPPEAGAPPAPPAVVVAVAAGFYGKIKKQ